MFLTPKIEKADQMDRQRDREAKRRRDARPFQDEHRARMDASQRIKEEAEAKLKREMDEANRDDETTTANAIAERTRKAFEVRGSVCILEVVLSHINILVIASSVALQVGGAGGMGAATSAPIHGGDSRSCPQRRPRRTAFRSS